MSTVSQAGSSPDSQNFVDLCTQGSEILRTIAVSKGASGDLVGALSCALGSDLMRIQGALWEALIVSAGTSYRKYFQLGEEIARACSEPTAEPNLSIAQALLAVRSQVEPILSNVGIRGFQALMIDVEPFDNIAFPSSDVIAAHAAQRLEGMTPQSYARKQMQAASTLSVQAFTAHSSGNIEQAINLMFASDFTALDAYLVESAHAAGDRNLFTVQIRWELATHCVSLIDELPQDFAAAAHLVRAAITQFMGDADAVRLRAVLPAV